MEFMSPEMLKTTAGAALVVTMFVAVLKQILPSVSGRVTQFVALGVSVVIGVLIGKWSTPDLAFISIANGLVIFASAMGIDQAVNYKKASE